jgi:hypothetical protein
MPIDWSKLEDVGTDLLDVIKPYLPVLAREGPEFFDGFIKKFINKDWSTIDAEMYERMSIEERRVLEAAVLNDAYKAAKMRYNNIQLTKEIMLKVVIRLVLSVI